MKRILYNLLIIALIMSILSSCGTYKPPSSDLDGGKNEETNTEGGGENTEEEKGTPFTATVIYNGLPYSGAEGIYVQWNDGYHYHTAKVGADGKATVYGLDGDYTVTLLSVPEGFGYNPAVHTATSDRTDTNIEIYRIIETTGSGEGLYSDHGCINVSKTGVYKALIEDAEDIVYFEFRPSEAGTYGIESWIDVNLAEINPKVDIFGGTFAFKYYLETRDEGGVCKGYTRNFKWEVALSEDMIGNVYTFGVKATTKDGVYPVEITLAITRDGGFERPGLEKTMILPTEDFKQTPEYDPALYEYVGAEVEKNGRYIFDGSMWRIFEKSEDVNGDGVGDGDGYYHLYDPVKYAANGGYGPILYAKINQPCAFMTDAFTTIEDHGNQALTVNVTENHKFFIEGYGVEAGYFCVAHAQNNVYCPCLKTCGGMCVIGCTKCHNECRQVSQELLDCKGGYADFCNSDGVYAVTAELQYFLQSFSISQRLFADGDGIVEEGGVDAMEDDQWLFACGYYKER